MCIPQPSLNAAIRALRGESDPNAILPALLDARLARIIALSPDACSIIRVVAALCGALPDVLNRRTVDAPDVRAAIVPLIGTHEGTSALWGLARVADAGWGGENDVRVALINAVPKKTCAPGVAAALIGPCDQSAALLTDHDAIAFAIRCWGKTNHDDPAWWTRQISAPERRRLLDCVQRNRIAVSTCLPWLPPGSMALKDRRRIAMHAALDAFTDASPTARSLHADLLQLLVARAEAAHLDALARLACVLQAEDVWNRIATLLQDAANSSERDLSAAALGVVTAAPWNDLAENVRAAILERADESEGCAAIAVARGRHANVRLTKAHVAAFFASLTPDVWNAFDGATQRRWLHALWKSDAYLAVRSLGARPEILARALLDDSLVRAVKRHAPDDATLCAALLPIELRNVTVVDMNALITAMTTLPPDPVAFVGIASGRAHPVRAAPAAFRTPADVAVAAVLQRIAYGNDRLQDACAALHMTLHQRTKDDVDAIIAFLPDDARAMLTPDPKDLAVYLAAPNRLPALLQAFDLLASLPPDIDMPVRFALARWRTDHHDVHATAEAVAYGLRKHGEVFLALTDAIADDDLRAALLPLPEHAALADALRALARDDPPSAQRLAHALRVQRRRETTQALLTAAPLHAVAIWGALPDHDRRAIMTEIAREEPAERPRPGPWRHIAEHDPIAALALAALRSNDAALRGVGITALQSRTDALRAIWMQLPPDVQTALRMHPDVGIAGNAPVAPP